MKIEYTETLLSSSKIMNILLDSVLKNKRNKVEYLLASGSDPNFSDDNGFSLLHWSCQECYIEMVKLLHKYGANFDIIDINGITPLFNSSGQGSIAIVETLLGLGADINKTTNLGSALHNACAYENIKIVDILLKNNVDIDIKNENGCLAIDMTDNIIIKNKLIAFNIRKIHKNT